MSKTFAMKAMLTALVALSAAPLARASTFTTIYKTPNGTTFQPVAGLHSNGILFGTDPAGGTAKDGIVFALNAQNQLSTVHSFAGADGSTPNGRLALVSNVIYGTARAGGASGAGTIFAINQTKQNAFTLLHSFTSASEGTSPRDGLAIDPQNGLLIGTTSKGAISPGNGGLFSMSTGGAFSVMWLFQSKTDGHCPFTGVTIDGLGTIYGTTVGYAIGGNPMGSIWGLPPGGTIQTMYVFTDGADGKFPMVTPTVDASGNVWGVSNMQSSKAYAGAIWEIPSGGSFRIVYSFTGGADGFGPNSPLLLGQDGNFYGTTTSGGGTANAGTFYRITPAGVFSVAHTFTGGADGGNPTPNLTADSSGQIYGGTSLGTIFKYKP